MGKNNSWIGNNLFYRAYLTPHREAVYDYDRKLRYTYGDLEDRANLLANYLIEKLNVKKGDRIAACTRNCIELFDMHHAAAKTGAILVTYNPLLTEHELLEMINHEEPKVMFYEEMFYEKVKKFKSETKIENYIVLTNASESIEDIHYEEILKYRNNTYREMKDLDLEDIHMIIHTGGTTGTPKGAMISYRSLLFNTMTAILTFNLSRLDSTYTMIPLFHTAGWFVFTIPLLRVGGRVIITKKCEPKVVLKIFNDEKPTVLLSISTIYRMLINEPEFETTDLSSFRWMISGAAPTSIDIMERFWEKGVKFACAYGLTEAGPNNLTVLADDMQLEEIKEKYNSVGKPFYFTKAKIVDEEGNEVGANQCGELIWSSPAIFSGYWNNERETSEVLVDGWVHTGDIAKKDKDGFYYIVGRKKNMFISGGENIFPQEIEHEIYKHPAVYEVCVIGVPDIKWGEVGKAVITLKGDKRINAKEIKKFLTGKIGSIKIPKYVQIVDEIPKNAAGKIQRQIVNDLYGKTEAL